MYYYALTFSIPPVFLIILIDFEMWISAIMLMSSSMKITQFYTIWKCHDIKKTFWMCLFWEPFVIFLEWILFKMCRVMLSYNSNV